MARQIVLAMITDADGRLAFANGDLLALGGWRWGDICGRVWHEVLIPPEHRHRVVRDFDRAVSGTAGAGCVEAPFRTSDGRVRVVAWSATPSLDESGRPTTVTSVGVDVTRWTEERDRIAAERDFDASHDRLTGLPNASSFRWRLGAELTAGRGGGRSTGVLLVALDRLRTVVETLGQEAGDQLIAEMAERVSDCVEAAVGVPRQPGGAGDGRPLTTWMVARWSDDEFAVLLPGLVFPAEAVFMARSIIATIAAPCTGRAAALRLSAAAGIAVAPEDGDSPETLMRHAAIAQHAGRTVGERLARFELCLSQEAEDRLLIEQQLPLALERGELSVAFQPEVDASSQRIVGLEALARWHHPVLGDVPPVRFIPVAEEIGVITDIGHFILRSAVRQAARWRSEGLGDVRVAVNVSAHQLRDRSLVEAVLGCLDETGFPARLLELEVTESAATGDSHSAAEVLGELARQGVSISLDDFGTGYSNLGKLHNLAISTIKIDRSFLLEDDANPAADPGALLHALVTLGRNLGLRVIAEGVETQEQLNRLRPQGLDAYQGFLFSRPVAATEVHRLLREGRPLGFAAGAQIA
ncbi:MAG: putative bifunctional diguanylate cyclase/phosphodiesterase [Candidatus Dormibacteria bacterium]